MKKIIALLLFLLFLVSCAKEATLSTAETEASALEYFDKGNIFAAGSNALKALENGSDNPKMQYIASKISGAYSTSRALITKNATTDFDVSSLFISENEVVASDKISRNVFNKKAELVSDTQRNAPAKSLKCETNGISFSYSHGMLCATRNGKTLWQVEINEPQSIFPFVHSMYNTNAEVTEYTSLIVIGEKTIDAFDIKTGEVVFHTLCDYPIIYCAPNADGTIILATKKFLSTACSLFSNKANSPLFASGDFLRFADKFTFEDEVEHIAIFDNNTFVTANKNLLTFYNIVSYDTHPRLNIDVFPTAIADKGNVLAIGSYEYLDGKRHNYFILFDVVKNELVTKIELDLEIKGISPENEGWKVFSDSECVIIKNNAEITKEAYTPKKEKPQLPSLELDFELSELSTIKEIDENTLFITEFENSGECIIYSTDKAEIIANVEGGIYYMADVGKILFRKGSTLGLYDYLDKDSLINFTKSFLERY